MRILQRSVGHASLETAAALDHCNNRMIYQALVIINIYRGLPFRVIASVRIQCRQHTDQRDRCASPTKLSSGLPLLTSGAPKHPIEF